MTHLTPAEAAKLAAVTVTTVRQWIAAGELQAVNVSRKSGCRPRWRIEEQALTEFLSSRASTSVPATSRRRRKRSGSSDVIEFCK